MQNAAFAARGLDWAYEARGSRTPSPRCGLVAEGFAGVNVTIPHKQAVVAASDEAEGEAVNTLVFRDGRVLGANTDNEILAGIEAKRACVIGPGGAASTCARAPRRDARLHPERRVAAGRRGLHLIVNATPVREEVLVVPHAGQVAVDLAYTAGGGDTALVAAARVAPLRGGRRPRGARPSGREELRAAGQACARPST